MPDQCPTQWCHYLPTSGHVCASAAHHLFTAMVSPSHFVKEDIYFSSPFLPHLSIKRSCKDYWKRLSVTSLRLTYWDMSTSISVYYSFLSFHCTVLAPVLMFFAFTYNLPHGTFSILFFLFYFFLYQVNLMDKISLSEKGIKQHDMLLSLW